MVLFTPCRHGPFRSRRSVLSNPALRDHPTLRSIAQWSAPLIAFLAQFNAVKLFSITALVFIMPGIICCMSRGAWLAAMGGLVSLAVLAVIRSRSRSAVSLLLPASVLGFVLIAWLGRYELVQARFATLTSGAAAADVIANWQDALRTAKDFRCWGVGWERIRYTYPLHEQKPIEAWFYHAENQFLESLTDGGVVGLPLLSAAIGLLFLACVRLLREPAHSPATLAVSRASLPWSLRVLPAPLIWALSAGEYGADGSLVRRLAVGQPTSPAGPAITKTKLGFTDCVAHS